MNKKKNHSGGEEEEESCCCSNNVVDQHSASLVGTLNDTSKQQNIEVMMHRVLERSYSNNNHRWNRCTLTRAVHGCNKYFPSFQLRTEDDSFYLTARLRKKTTHTKYLISVNREVVRRESPETVCTVQSNFLGSEWTITTSSQSPIPMRVIGCVVLDKDAYTHAAIVKDMTDLSFDSVPDSIIRTVKGGGNHSKLFTLHYNHQPNFINRSELSTSSKTCQLCVSSSLAVGPVGADDVQSRRDAIVDPVFQFGRLNKDTFALDFKDLLSPVHAFAIALTLF
jgi:hypothetical protein